ncbi:MAG TPA: asparagine synthase-related protein, partial [Planctomycetota bacterium]|nr:asparagine synthase-related protein [Planctomycetota bacterium]
VEDFVAGPFAARNGAPAEAAGFADLHTYLPHDILVKVDIASMANGLEVRCPFLDPEVVELALRMPARVRMGKAVVRRAFEGLCPPGTFDRPKQGFGVPVAEWLRGELRPLLEEATRSLEGRGWLDGGEIRRLREEHLSGAADHRDRLWLLLVLELWARTRP